MKNFTNLTGLFSVIIAAFALVLTSIPANAKSLPIDNWAVRDVVSSVSLSPDGKHVAILKVESKEGENILEIYKTDDFSKPFRRLNAKPMELISAQWVSDNHLFGTAWQQVRKKVRKPEQDSRNYTTYSYNLEKNKFSQISGNFGIVNTLPKEPDNLLVTSVRQTGGSIGVNPFDFARYASYYKFNLKKGTTSLVIKGNEKYGNIGFDNEGNPRFAVGYDAGSEEQVFYYRKIGGKDWTEFERLDIGDPKNRYEVLGGFQGFVGTKPNDPNTGWVIAARNGEDKAAIWEFDFDAGKYGKKVFSTPGADVMGVQTHSHPWGGKFDVVAARYPGAKMERHWFDMEEKALHEQFERKIPNSHSVRITSRSRDGQSMIVFNNGPKDPGSYWFVQNGKMAKLASRNPLVSADDLSPVEFIKYPARDGKMIPAYVTKPKGAGPHPLIVLPHGGPHVNEVIGYDEWGQLLANNGYMVLQPQYRMSVGWGREHFDSAMNQHGLAMQDDKDDGAMYLVNKGWAAKDRIAMFGWSYGGYAALVAASRSPNLYQCTIAGAAVADPKKVYLKRSRGGGGVKSIDDWARARGGFVGVNPIEEVDKVNIPILMVHGKVDSRVMYFNYEDYKKAIEKAGKKAQFLTLDTADHFYTTLMYNHQTEFYTKMLDFLENDCGPGGL